jgi:hypothetical protein
MTACGAGTMTIRSVTGKGKPTIWRWQERYMSDGTDGLFRDAPCGRAFAAASPEQVATVVERTLHETPSVATHWTLRAQAVFAPDAVNGGGGLARSPLPSRAGEQCFRSGRRDRRSPS